MITVRFNSHGGYDSMSGAYSVEVNGREIIDIDLARFQNLQGDNRHEDPRVEILAVLVCNAVDSWLKVFEKDDLLR